MDDAVNIDIRCIDVDGATGNIAACCLAVGTRSCLHSIRNSDVRLASDHLLVFIFISILHIAAHINDTSSIILGDAAASCQGHSGTQYSNGILGIFSCNTNIIVGTGDGHSTTLVQNIPFYPNIGHGLVLARNPGIAIQIFVI